MTDYRRPRNSGEKVARRLARYRVAIALVDRDEASPQLRRAVELLREGRNGIQIGKEMGIARSTAYQLLNDPHGVASQARKAKAQRPCVDCGKPCNMDGRTTEPAERCLVCSKAKQVAEARWKPAAILEAIRRWAATYGAPPQGKRLELGECRGVPRVPAWRVALLEHRSQRLRVLQRCRKGRRVQALHGARGPAPQATDQRAVGRHGCPMRGARRRQSIGHPRANQGRGQASLGTSQKPRHER